MSYQPPNPYDPSQQPGYGQPSAPKHYTTDSDPYSRPDPYGPGPGYGNPPLHVQPGSAPPGRPQSPAPGYVPGQPGGFGPPPPAGPVFQPGQPAPPPPRNGSNAPLFVTIAIVLLVVVVGGVVLVMNLGGEEDPVDPVAQSTSESVEETTEAVEETTAEPTEEATTGSESEYRVPEVGECIENVTTGFYVVDCEAESAYWYVAHIVNNPEDPEPEDSWHSVAAADACEGQDYTQYYYTDTALAAGRDWDPSIDSITAIYCVRPV